MILNREQFIARLRMIGHQIGRQVRVDGPVLFWGHSSPVCLDSIRRQFSDEPDEVIVSVLESSHAEPLEATAWLEVAPRVRARVYHRGQESIDLARIPYADWIGELVIAALVELDDGIMQNVSREQVAAWGVEPSTVLTQGVANVETLPTIVSLHAPGYAVVRMRDGFDAARLLTGKVYRMIARTLGTQEYLAWLPSRDLVLAAHPRNESAILDAQILAGRAYRSDPYPISEERFIRCADGAAEWQPWSVAK